MNTLTSKYQNDTFDLLVESIKANWPDKQLFATNIDGNLLFDTFLDGIPASFVQEYSCNCCRKFFTDFANLVYVNDNNELVSALWSNIDVPEFFAESIENIKQALKKVKIADVFVSDEKVWGRPETGYWRHFAVTPLNGQVYKPRVLTSNQERARIRENVKNIKVALADFDVQILTKVVSIIESEVLDRSEKVEGPANWLLNLQKTSSTLKGPKRDNYLWSEVAKAPEGFCHPRSSVWSTILEDLEKGVDFETAAKSFNAKMKPTEYQRPKAAPKSGTIDKAEKLVDQLGLRPSFARKFATLDEIQTLWRFASKDESTNEQDGMFGHLRPKAKTEVTKLDYGKITFAKFQKLLTGSVLKIELYVTRNGPFAAFTSAVNPDAPPILQWDTHAHRNTVCQYTYNNGSSASTWGLKSDTWQIVTAIAMSPWNWHTKNSHFSEGAMFVLEGAVDRDVDHVGLYPETLKPEFHEIRSVVEAYSQNGKLEGAENANACGWLLRNSTTRVRIYTENTVTTYEIDRWD